MIKVDYGEGKCESCQNFGFVLNVMVPCGHNGICKACLEGAPHCFHCEKRIDSVIQVFNQLRDDTLYVYSWNIILIFFTDLLVSFQKPCTANFI